MNTLLLRPSSLGRLFSPAGWSAPATAAAAPASLLPRLFSTSPRARDADALAPSQPAVAGRQRKTVPPPTPLVPDVTTFLTVIGRNMKQHAVKFPTWEAMFTLSSKQLRDLGVEPPRARRYLLRWLEKFRLGHYGVAGDFAYVRNGVAELRAQTLVDPANPYSTRKIVVNVPVPEAAESSETVEGETEAPAATAAPAEIHGEPARVRGYKVVGADHIAGPYALPLKGNVGARVTVTEGMWEDKLGRKIDGGERRQAEVRFKRRAAERRAERERLNK